MLCRSLRPVFTSASLVVVAATLMGCGGGGMSEMTFFPNKGSLFKSQDWAAADVSKNAPEFLSSRPVSPDDQVDAAGACMATSVAPQTDVAVGTVAGDLGTSAGAAPAEQAVVPGGVALGMTECQVVSHAGRPGQVDIGADDKGDRKVVLTYLSGPWPGIYTFTSGRLKVVDRVAQPEQPKPARKKARGPKTANSATTR